MSLLSRLMGRRPARPTLESLEERALPSGFSAIQANFNSTRIPTGDTIWFNSAVKVSGLGSTPATIRLVNSAIDFTANGASYHLNVPDADIVFSPTATQATTTFDSADNRWETTIPASATGNAFLSGLAMPVTSSLPGLLPLGGGLLGGLLGPLTSALPGSINPTWSGTFQSDTPGLTVTWKWSAAVYDQFDSDYNDLGVKPVDGSQLSAYHNSDLAGTPEAFRNAVTAGARGGGGTNYTGTYSSAAQVAPDYVPPPPPPNPPPAPALGSLSGHVYFDNDLSGSRDAGEGGQTGWTVVLSGTDYQGNSVYLTATTDGDGSYTFSGLLAGDYQLSVVQMNPAWDATGASVGSAGGTALDDQTVGLISLGAGVEGTDYDFGEYLFA
jgi:hypothetical protein